MVDPLAGRIRCRAKDLFNPIFVTRKGAQFVFAGRLLKKTRKQLARIRAWIALFAEFYVHFNKAQARLPAAFRSIRAASIPWSTSVHRKSVR